MRAVEGAGAVDAELDGWVDHDIRELVTELESLARRVGALQLAAMNQIENRGLPGEDGHVSAKVMVRLLAKLSPGDGSRPTSPPSVIPWPCTVTTQASDRRGANMVGIRRVVTGHDEDGKAVFASDEVVDGIRVDLVPGVEFHRIWDLDETPRFPDDGSPGPPVDYFPPVGGVRFGLFTLSPDSTQDLGDIDLEAAVAELEERLPGAAAHMEPDNPGMHTTASVDFEYIVSGRVVLELDDGETRVLSAGDTVVQNGTRHAWRNPFDEPAQLVVVLIGVHHDALPSAV